jgi:Pyridoxamine 5'-phosphate oxidase
MSELSMSPAEREQFLADVRVGVLTIERPGRAPLATPVWYQYRPGGVVEIMTGGDSQKTRLLEAVGRASLCAQREQLPYAYVTVEGPVTLGASTYDLKLDIATRYLGVDAGRAYVDGSPGDDVAIALTPTVWYSADFAKFELT